MPPDATRPLRVLHAVSHYGVVSEGFVVDAVTEVEAHGCESWVLTRTLRDRDTFPAPPDARIVRWDARSRRRFSLKAQLRTAAAATGPALDLVRPDIIHCHFGWNLLDVVEAARQRSIPVVATFHATDVTTFPWLGPRQRLLPGWRRHGHRYAPVFPHVAAGLAVSDYIAATVRRLGFDAPLHVVPAGVRLERFTFRRGRRDAEGDELRLVFVGRLVRRKGLDVLLRALAIRDGRARTQLAVVGDGPERVALEELTRSLGLADAVTFHGALPRTDVVDVMSGSDVLVMSSRTMPDGEVEGSPVVTKEAQAVGLQIVATDNGGTRETLPPEHRDSVVPEEDPTALARAIDEVAADRARWGERAERGRSFVAEEFGWANLAERTVAIYRGALLTAAHGRAGMVGRA